MGGAQTHNQYIDVHFFGKGKNTVELQISPMGFWSIGQPIFYNTSNAHKVMDNRISNLSALVIYLWSSLVPKRDAFKNYFVLYVII